MAKEYSVSGFFPEVPSGVAEQSCRVTANNIGTAARRGFDEMRARPGISGKRIKTVKLTIRAIDHTAGGSR